MNDGQNATQEPDGWLYVFAAKGLQAFVLGSDELRDMVGATELIDQLPRKLLQTTIDLLKPVRGHEVLSQAAGCARIRFDSEEDARRLASVWPMICAHAAPGLEIAQTVVPIEGGRYLEAIHAAEENLVRERNLPCASLPEITPVVARNPRSGLPAGTTEHDRDNNKERVPVDIQSAAKRPHRECRTIFNSFGLSPEGGWDGWSAPESFESISGEEREYLAIVHADGNGLGQLFIRLGRTLAGQPGIERFYKDLSEAIDMAGKGAAQAAVQAVRDRFLRKRDGKDDPDARKIWPLLPVVLAGDDLTVVIRSDLALDFTEAFLLAFVENTRQKFKDIKSSHPKLPLDGTFPDCLTAGAGVAFVKRRFPFSSAYALCESLAGFAKRGAKSSVTDGQIPPCSLAFHRVSASSTSEDFSTLLETELLVPGIPHRTGEPATLMLSMAPYAVGEVPAGSALKPLSLVRGLADAALDLPGGQVRELLSLVETDPERAKKHAQRIQQTQARESRIEPGKRQGALFCDRLKAMTGDGLRDAAGRCPLADALTLAHFAKKGRAYCPPPGGGRAS